MSYRWKSRRIENWDFPLDLGSSISLVPIRSELSGPVDWRPAAWVAKQWIANGHADAVWGGSWLEVGILVCIMDMPKSSRWNAYILELHTTATWQGGQATFLVTFILHSLMQWEQLPCQGHLGRLGPGSQAGMQQFEMPRVRVCKQTSHRLTSRKHANISNQIQQIHQKYMVVYFLY